MFQNIQNDYASTCDVSSVTTCNELRAPDYTTSKGAKTMRIVVTAGGTGGHINPALVVASELRERKNTLLFIGSLQGPEEQKAHDAGLEFLGLNVKGFDRANSLNRLTAAAQLPWAINNGLKALSVFRPDAVIGFGGYASGPASIAALIKSVPLFLLEQNVYPGLVTRMLRKRARRVYSSFSESGGWLKGADVIYAGNPTRRGFYNPGRTYKDKKSLTLLVMGGSQGARSINRAMIDALLLIRDFDLKVYHQSGLADVEEVKSAYARFMPDAVVAPYFDNMDEVMADADIAIARAGASTCAELALSCLPAILIPYRGAGGHQVLNANVLVDNGAARMIDDAELSGELLAQNLGELIRDKFSLERMSANSREMAKPDASKIIVRDIIKTLEA